ncbi:MAG: ATP-binding protein [Chloroflexota bacterium]
MSKRRQHPWLADDIIFYAYRWFALITTTLIVLVQAEIATYGWWLLGLACVSVLATFFARPYTDVARRNPVVMTFDVLLAAVVLVGASDVAILNPFIFYATSSLVLPGLLFGWRGGVMAGLAFVTFDLSAHWALQQRPPLELIQLGQPGVLALVMTMFAPPILGVLFPFVVDLLRTYIGYQSRAKRLQRTLSSSAVSSRRSWESSLSRFVSMSENDDLDRTVQTEQALVSSTAVRTTEQSTEDLRRVLFEPFASTNIDLPSALDTLATRFAQKTGAEAQLTLIGRTRSIHYAQQTALIRLAQEALLNVQQHAQAEAIELTLHYDGYSVVLLIQDDGVGLLDGTYERPGGLHALRAMRYRITELGGRLDIFETEDGGVSVRVMVPLE